MGIIIKKVDESKPALMENVLFDGGMSLMLTSDDMPAISFNILEEEGVKYNTFQHFYIHNLDKRQWKNRLLLWIMRRFGVDVEGGKWNG